MLTPFSRAPNSPLGATSCPDARNPRRKGLFQLGLELLLLVTFFCVDYSFFAIVQNIVGWAAQQAPPAESEPRKVAWYKEIDIYAALNAGKWPAAIGDITPAARSCKSVFASSP